MPVEHGGDVECLRIRDFIACDHGWARRSEAIERLASAPLRLRELNVASRDVVYDGVSENVIEGIRFRNVFGGRADDDAEFGFVVD
jgi:hypothetical protein